MEFKRQLSADALNYLKNDGSFIIPAIKAARTSPEAFSLDIQIRINNELMVYMGGTRILTIRIDTQNEKITFYANETYSDRFLGTYKFDDVQSGSITEYLNRTMPNVKPKWFSNKKEGYYQNMLCYKLGENAINLSPFIIFDRESEVGFTDTQESEYKFKPIADSFRSIRCRLQNDNPEKYGRPTDKGFGKGLDLLAIDEQCNLICIELKHGNNGSGICWGVLQLAVYHKLFNKLNTLDAQVFFSNIKELIEQKIKLGLLPTNVLSYFNKKIRFNGVKSYFVVAEPNFEMNCWDKMRDVIDEIPQDFRCSVLTIDNDGKFSIYL